MVTVEIVEMGPGLLAEGAVDLGEVAGHFGWRLRVSMDSGGRLCELYGMSKNGEVRIVLYKFLLLPLADADKMERISCMRLPATTGGQHPTSFFAVRCAPEDKIRRRFPRRILDAPTYLASQPWYYVLGGLVRRHLPLASNED
jgi:hypothetical protein